MTKERYEDLAKAYAELDELLEAAKAAMSHDDVEVVE